MTNILTTGCTGFVGRALINFLRSVDGIVSVGSSRSHMTRDSKRPDSITLRTIDVNTKWNDLIHDIDVIIHTAARVHVMNDTAADPLALFRDVNTAGTLNLARQAAAAGVRRFIFISSIKVNGESTQRDEVFRPDDVARPSDPYAISKYEAELGLLELAKTCAMEVVIIRPVLVYGPGVKANFLQLMRILRKGIPVPLGAIRNARSLVSLDNLVDFIRVCVDHPAAANQIFLVSDGEDLSTTELAKRLKAFMPLSGWLVPVPQSIIKFGAMLLGRKAAAQRVLGSLRVDISKNRDLLGWTPPISVDEALKKTVDLFLATEQK